MKKNSRPTQCERIIQYLRDFGSITSAQAMLDLGVAGVVIPDEFSALVQTACITYVKMHFGQNYDRGEAMSKGYDLKASYDEQKAQLATCTGFTDWLVE